MCLASWQQHQCYYVYYNQLRGKFFVCLFGILFVFNVPSEAKLFKRLLFTPAIGNGFLLDVTDSQLFSSGRYVAHSQTYEANK